MKLHSVASHTQKGFTLMELLVVISIIMLMMSISMPSLHRAKQQGQAVVCMSNVRQLTLAWFGYTIDYDDRLCSPATEFNYPRPWSDLLGPYGTNHWVSDGPGLPNNSICGTEKSLVDGVLWDNLETLDVYKCKSDHSGFIRSFAISHYMGCPETIPGEIKYMSMAGITSPSQRAVFVDAKLNPQRNAQGVMRSVGIDGCFNPIDAQSLTWRQGAVMITARHNEGCNMSFADMHCDPFRWQDRRTIQAAMDTMNWSGISMNNIDIERLGRMLRGTISGRQN